MTGDLLLVNLGGVATGSLDGPLVEAEAMLIRDGRIVSMGAAADQEDCELVLDAKGNLAAPGLIDSHVHTVLGDWTPRQNTIGFLESYSHGGVSRALSASEVHAPGRPHDPAGVKALALTAHRCFEQLRPGGMTVHGGSVILEPGLEEEDFAELAAQGVWQAKAGMGRFDPSRDVAPLVRAAQAHGFKVMCHTGGESIPDSTPVTADDLLEIRPDVAGHVNGGTTSLPDADLARVVASGIGLQICQAGNLRSALEVVRLAEEQGALERVLAASDTPTGTGVMPLAVIKSVVELASLGGVAPETALCFASGNVRRSYGLEAGVLEAGAPADVILLDAPLSSEGTGPLAAMAKGDLPSITSLITDGVVRFVRSRNTPPPKHMPELRPPGL